MKYLITLLLIVSFGQSYEYAYIGPWSIESDDCSNGRCFSILTNGSSRIAYRVDSMSRNEMATFVTKEDFFKDKFGVYEETSYIKNGVFHVIAKKGFSYSMGKWLNGVIIHAYLEIENIEEFDNMVFTGIVSTKKRTVFAPGNARQYYSINGKKSNSKYNRAVRIPTK